MAKLGTYQGAAKARELTACLEVGVDSLVDERLQALFDLISTE